MPPLFQNSPSVMALVMAGGRGQRLHPLTASRSKPAVPFGGKYRIVDFVLSSLVNSGIGSIYVLTQYRSQSLLEHMHVAWTNRLGFNSFITAVPAQMQAGETWYRGTADAIHQNLSLLDRGRPDLVAVFGADHVYKMNVRQMIDFHVSRDAGVTISCLPVPAKEATGFGVMKVDEDWRIRGFVEKVADPPEIPGRPGYCLASMGNYLFRPDVLVEVLGDDAADKTSEHDFGKSILPRIFDSLPVYAYDFLRNRIPMETRAEAAYWRDIGTLDTFHEANLDLKDVQPLLNLYNWRWPIRTASYNDPPAKFVFDEKNRRGEAVQSAVAGGCILAGGRVKDSVLGRNVFIDAGASVEGSVIFDNVHIGPGARVRNAIIDKNNRIPAYSRIGLDPDLDRESYTVSPGGVVVVARGRDTPEDRARNF